ncbi:MULTISPECIES: YicC/YloC family endoribonuclease [Oceanobacillus]|uniref:YicC family protein n=2 Tax=Bacillaceae TaxID=186817 RepID=A0A417YKG5_9BACI|nr:YicC/YloC family endoribonuclease [Oceanobacillus profundus]MBR3119450.1 YicC family protein [Oceanobacillus sp.]MDO6449708.1 YicC/YloC family endoribonuclease [Oceanobacillus profundus]RHW33710.1 YicC family protein [Oceanobacillus profundus]
MPLSMTGYGRKVLHIENTMVTIEIRSVNHRFLDIAIKLPRTFLFLEDKLKKTVQSQFTRGRIEVYISIEGDGFSNRTLQADWELIDQYVTHLDRAKQKYHLNGEIPLTVLSSMQDFFHIKDTGGSLEKVHQLILEGTLDACKQVSVMRQEEGVYLTNDLTERLRSITETVLQLRTKRDIVRKEYQERIMERIRVYVDDEISKDGKFYQEIVLLAEKGDITEEITRLLGHIEHFERTMNSKEAAGRKLDFIIQEMHREANTIGSKSTDVSISEWTVSLKSMIEKMKEQVQNIE